MADCRTLLLDLYQHALDTVHGEQAVITAAKSHLSPAKSYAVLSLGKAANAMMAGAHQVLSGNIVASLVITKQGHTPHPIDWPCFESAHPVPDERSLEAGAKVLKFIDNIPQDACLLVLVSGGTSALVEVLPGHMSLADLQAMNTWLLGSGLDIQQVNQVRQACSTIKGGGLCQLVADREVVQFLMSDVPGNREEFIGSGLFYAPETPAAFPTVPEWLRQYCSQDTYRGNSHIDSYIIASNEHACEAVAEKARQLGHTIQHIGQLAGDIQPMAKLISQQLLQAEAGVYIWGGETTVQLPEKPGRGGRNQALALAVACEIENSDGITVLVGATDGSDGPTDDAGAIVDAYTLQQGSEDSQHARDYLARADAGTYLEHAGALISTGPTGTNVMDVVIAIVDAK